MASGTPRVNTLLPNDFRETTYAGRVRLVSCSRDPIGYEGSEWNLCEYVHGKPIRYRDPSGRAAGIWNKFCEACRGAYEVGPFDAWGAAGIWGSGIGGDAQDFARTFDDPGESNAARHCYWQAMLTIHYGPDAAKGIGDAHEYGEDGNPDSVVDQFNNPIGRAIGGSVRGNEDIPCSERPKAVVADCTRAIRDGTLAVSPADPRLGLPGVGGTPPDSSSGDHLVLGTHPVLGIHQAEGLHNDVGLNCASKDLQLACLRGTLIRARVLELV